MTSVSHSGFSRGKLEINLKQQMKKTTRPTGILKVCMQSCSVPETTRLLIPTALDMVSIKKELN